jgi:glycosyltransferase involved in cell wall biosynthesis
MSQISPYRSPHRYHQVLVSTDLGGAGLTALHLAHYQRERGQDCRVWIPGAGWAWDEATRLGLSCHSYNLAAAQAKSKIRAGLANWALARRLRRGGPGLVHVHSPLHYGALWRGLRRCGLCRAVHVQIEEDPDGLRWAFRCPPELIMTCAEFLVEPVRRALPEEAQGRTRVVAVPNAVDTERFTPGPKVEAKRQLGAPADRPLAIMLANLSPHKGQETAIRAVALLKQRGVSMACWLAGVERGGSGAYTARLRSLIAEAGVQDRVQLLGQRRDTPDLLRAADFFLLPSTHEGLPLSILEAQASKVPVLAAPTAGVPEVVKDGETGFLIAAADAAGYACRLEDLLANPELYRRVADGGFTRATREYNWSILCRRITALYEEVLEGAAARSAPKRSSMTDPQELASAAGRRASPWEWLA